MGTQSGLVGLNAVEAPAETSSLGYWFAFTYYAPPALLAGREARRR